MKASEAYSYVLEEYEIKAKDIANVLGKSESDISKFRNGHRKINQDLLQLYIQALPEKARAHFNMLYSYGDEIEQLKLSEKANEYQI